MRRRREPFPRPSFVSLDWNGDWGRTSDMETIREHTLHVTQWVWKREGREWKMRLRLMRMTLSWIVHGWQGNSVSMIPFFNFLPKLLLFCKKKVCCSTYQTSFEHLIALFSPSVLCIWKRNTLSKFMSIMTLWVVTMCNKLNLYSLTNTHSIRFHIIIPFSIIAPFTQSKFSPSIHWPSISSGASVADERPQLSKTHIHVTYMCSIQCRQYLANGEPIRFYRNDCDAWEHV